MIVFVWRLFPEIDMACGQKWSRPLFDFPLLGCLSQTCIVSSVWCLFSVSEGCRSVDQRGAGGHRHNKKPHERIRGGPAAAGWIHGPDASHCFECFSVFSASGTWQPETAALTPLATETAELNQPGYKRLQS